jgi:hypothetical protein
MVHECCILFLHHLNDQVTRWHFDLLRRFNPYPVIPIHAAQLQHLPDAIDVGHLTSPWHEADLAFIRWFLHRPFDAKRYILMEYDTLATMPLWQFYGPLWDKDVVVPHLRIRSHEPLWEWFEHIPLLPPDLQPFAAGVSPMTAILLSHRAMLAISGMPLPDVFSELRLGTLLRAAGMEMSVLPRDVAANIHWDPTLIQIDPDLAGVYHPVKVVIPGVKDGG